MSDMPARMNKTSGWLFLVAMMIVWGLISCASSSDLHTFDGSLVNSTLTLFQPQASNDGILSGSTDAKMLVGATFTPYPTRSVAAQASSSSIQVISTPGGSSLDSNLLSTFNPLTGLPISDPALLERRPMVIKVANAPDYVRPQSGLTLADVVYEYYIEWGDTRFIAVMYGNDSPMVGPVRSGRFFDEHVARMYNAFLVFKFADPREYSYLKESTLNEFLVVPGTSTCPPFVIGPQKRDTYNNIFFDTSRWASCAARRGLDNTRQTLRGGFFNEQLPSSSLVATRVYTRYYPYSYNYWEYEPITNEYFRYQEAKDMINGAPESYALLHDSQTGMPVTANNVVVLFVPYIFSSQFDAEDEVYHIDLIDFGDAYVFRDGLASPAVWNRTDENQPLLITHPDGTPFFLKPGRTFYEVIGTSSSYLHSGTEWKFDFATP